MSDTNEKARHAQALDGNANRAESNADIIPSVLCDSTTVPARAQGRRSVAMPQDCRIPLCERCNVRPSSHDVHVPGRRQYAHVCELCLKVSERYPEQTPEEREAEAVEMARELELAKARQGKGQGVENVPHPIEDTGKSRDKAAEAVGWSGKTETHL